MEKQRTKTLILLSNGLDSRLVCKIMQEQSEVLALYFKLPFTKLDTISIKEFCKKEKIKLKIIDCTKGKLMKEYLYMLKHPKFSRGTALNPCIDCHLFMLKKAKEIADKLHIITIATGEVLNERPLSQNPRALRNIEREAKLERRLLRPLSAKLMEETLDEIEGKLNREKFYSIHGRQRKIQFELAKKYNIEFPSPGGGCLLCEPIYCEKLKNILNKPKINQNEINLLKIGRHYNSSQIIIGRNQDENKFLEKQKGIKLIPKQIGGTALIRTDKNKKENLIEEAKILIKKHSKHDIQDFEIISS